ncbi:MAG: ATP-binding cassette domain-containing protein, partial [Actinomycetota bacterium]
MSLELSGVGVTIAGRQVVRDVTCTLPTAGWLGVLGPNGAGKTTLLRAVAGLVEHRGSVSLDGSTTAEM